MGYYWIGFRSNNLDPINLSDLVYWGIGSSWVHIGLDLDPIERGKEKTIERKKQERTSRGRRWQPRLGRDGDRLAGDDGMVDRPTVMRGESEEGEKRKIERREEKEGGGRDGGGLDRAVHRRRRRG